MQMLATIVLNKGYKDLAGGECASSTEMFLP